jgi:hypothetical protein
MRLCPRGVGEAAGECNDQVNARVLLVVKRFVELDQDCPLADFTSRIRVVLQQTFDDIVSHLMNDVIGRRVVTVGAQLRVCASVQDNAAVGIGDGLVDGAVRDASGVEGLQSSREAASMALDEVPPSLRFGEDVIIDGDLSAHIGEHLLCVVHRGGSHIGSFCVVNGAPGGPP